MKRSSRTARTLLVAVGIASLLVAPTALAGKGGKPGTGGGGTTTGSTVSLVLLDGATEPKYGGRITFSASTSAERPFVGVRCYQGTNFVYDGYVGLFADYMFDPWLTLGSDYWAAGVAANCTARLFYYGKRGNQVVLATTTFAVAP